MTATVSSIITRGQVWLADLGTPTGSEQGGVRPVLVVQNDVGNRFSPTILVSPLTSSKSKRNLPTHVILRNTTFLPEVSTALIEQMRSIDRGRLIKMLGNTNDHIMIKIDEAIKVQTALKQQFNYSTAFDMIQQIKNIKLEIKELGKRQRLMEMYHYQMRLFKEYCGSYGVDHEMIVADFKNQEYLCKG